MKKLLVTGGSGFLGQQICKQAYSKFDTYGTYCSNPIKMINVEFVSMNLMDAGQIESCLNQIYPDIIIHTAAITNVDFCESHHETCYQANVLSTEEITRWANKNQCRLIYTSSDMVFDGKGKMYKEADFANPINYYGDTKLVGEKKVTETCPNAVVARIALMYGESLTKSSFSSQLLKRLKNGEIIPIFNDQFRSPLWIENAAEALLELAVVNFSGIIHLAGSDRVDRYTFSKYLAELHHIPISQLKATSIFDVDLTAQRPQDASMDITLAKSILQTKLLGYQAGIKNAYN